MWVYSQRQDSVIEGKEHLTNRVFNTGVLSKPFCKHCGVHICNDLSPLTGKLDMDRHCVHRPAGLVAIMMMMVPDTIHR